jgi:DNA-binding winged helix-turn-helix (wHTH) protein/tetratricopeptide (TPR) repeat protein
MNESAGVRTHMKRPIYRFGDFCIDPALRQLRHAGSAVQVPPKVFECIVYLIENRERAVGKDELVAGVWGTVSASDSQVAQTILRARRILDVGGDRDLILTLPRFGYRWVAEVHEETTAIDQSQLLSQDAQEPDTAAPEVESAAQPEPAPAAGARGWLGGRRTWVTVVAILVLVASVSLWRIWSLYCATSTDVRVATTAPDSGNTFAVLPVDVQLLDRNWAWLEIGLMEVVATELRQGGLSVVPTKNVLMLVAKDSAVPDSTLLETLGAGNLVRVYARKTAAGWIVTLNLDSTDKPTRRLDSVSDNVIDAGRRAADRVLLIRGKPAKVRSQGSDDLAIEELAGRIYAAHENDGHAKVRQIIEAAPPEQREAPRVQIALADAERESGNLVEAEARYRRVLDMRLADDSPHLEALATIGVALVELAQGNHAEFERLYDVAIALREKAGDWSGLAHARLRRAIVRSGEMDLDGARADLAAARVDATLASDRFVLARIEANQGVVAALEGHYTEASELLRNAIPRFRQFGAYDNVINAQTFLAEANLDQLLPREALAAVDEVWSDRFRVAMIGSRNGLERTRARTLLSLGQIKAAGDLIEQVAAEQVLGRDTEDDAQLDLLRAMLASERDDGAAVQEYARRAVARFGRPFIARQRACAWLYLIGALRASGQTAQVDEQVDRLVQWSDTDAGSGGRAYAKLAEAEQAGSGGDVETSLRLYAQAFDIAKTTGVSSAIVAVAVSYGNTLIDRGRAPQAKSIVGVSVRLGEQSPSAQLLQARFYEALGQSDAAREARERMNALLGERKMPRWPGSLPDM